MPEPKRLTPGRTSVWVAALAASMLLIVGPMAGSAMASSPTLANESVFGLGTFQVEPGSTCNADGSGVINFSANGTASGPFPGSLTETGSITLGPTPPPSGGVTFHAPVTAYNSTFTITSGSTTITGTRTLGEPADTLPWGFFDLVNVGECLAGPFTTNQFGVGLRYNATIATPGGPFLDTGFGHAFGAENRFLNPSNLVEEEFASLSGATVPDAPTNVVAAAGDGSAAVSWLPPASNGGNPVRNYIVTASPGGESATACQGLSTDVTCHITSATLTGLSNGVSYTFTVRAKNAVGEGADSAPSNQVTPQSGNVTPAVAVGTASPSSSTTIDTGAIPPPSGIASSVTVPAGTAGGPVSIVQTGTADPPPGGYTFLGQQANISAPDGTVANPLVLAFNIGGALLSAAGLDETTVQVFRDGVAIDSCDASSSGANPDPCVAERAPLAGGGATLAIRSSHASVWNLGKRLPFSFSGFFQPVDLAPTLNTVKAGTAIPVKFSLAGYQGLGILAAGFPKSGVVDCDPAASVDAIEQTVSAGQSSLSYSAATDQYTYVWKTDKSWSGRPGGPCRRLVLKFVDGSEKSANFSFRK